MESNEKIKIYDKGVEILKSEEDLNQTRIQYRIGDIHIPALPNREALANEARHIVECCKDLSKPIADGNQGLLVVRILEAADRSMHMNQKVEL